MRERRQRECACMREDPNRVLMLWLTPALASPACSGRLLDTNLEPSYLGQRHRALNFTTVALLLLSQLCPKNYFWLKENKSVLATRTDALLLGEKWLPRGGHWGFGFIGCSFSPLIQPYHRIWHLRPSECQPLTWFVTFGSLNARHTAWPEEGADTPGGKNKQLSAAGVFQPSLPFLLQGLPWTVHSILS